MSETHEEAHSRVLYWLKEIKESGALPPLSEVVDTQDAAKLRLSPADEEAFYTELRSAICTAPDPQSALSTYLGAPTPLTDAWFISMQQNKRDPAAAVPDASRECQNPRFSDGRCPHVAFGQIPRMLGELCAKPYREFMWQTREVDMPAKDWISAKTAHDAANLRPSVIDPAKLVVTLLPANLTLSTAEHTTFAADEDGNPSNVNQEPVTDATILQVSRSGADLVPPPDPKYPDRYLAGPYRVLTAISDRFRTILQEPGAIRTMSGNLAYLLWKDASLLARLEPNYAAFREPHYNDAAAFYDFTFRAVLFQMVGTEAADDGWWDTPLHTLQATHPASVDPAHTIATDLTTKAFPADAPVVSGVARLFSALVKAAADPASTINGLIEVLQTNADTFLAANPVDARVKATFAKVYNLQDILPLWPPADYPSDAPPLVTIPGYRIESNYDWTMRILRRLDGENPETVFVTLKAAADDAAAMAALAELTGGDPVTRFTEWSAEGTTEGYAILIEANDPSRFLANLRSSPDWPAYTAKLAATKYPTEFTASFFTQVISAEKLRQKPANKLQQLFVFIDPSANPATDTIATVTGTVPIRETTWVQLRTPFDERSAYAEGVFVNGAHNVQGYYLQKYEPVATKLRIREIRAASAEAQNLWPDLFGAPPAQEFPTAPALNTSTIGKQLNAINAQANVDPNAAFRTLKSIQPKYAVALAPAAPVLKKLGPRGFFMGRDRYRRTLKTGIQQVRDALGLSRTTGTVTGDLELIIRLAENPAVTNAAVYERILAWKTQFAATLAALSLPPTVFLGIRPEKRMESTTAYRATLLETARLLLGLIRQGPPSLESQETSMSRSMLRILQNKQNVDIPAAVSALRDTYPNAWRAHMDLAVAAATPLPKAGLFGRLFGARKVSRNVRRNAAALKQALNTRRNRPVEAEKSKVSNANTAPPRTIPNVPQRTGDQMGGRHTRKNRHRS